MITLVASALTNAVLAGSEATFWFPPQASTTAAEIDWIYYFVYWISVFFTVIIFGATVWFAIKFRSKKTAGAAAAGHNTALEVTWTVVPGILCVFIFYFGLTGYMDTHTPPDDAYVVNVTGVKWAWAFTYPDGTVSDTLHVPVHRPVRLVMTSEDVIHAMFIPAFRTKQDVVPGRYTEEWFEATETGEFQIFCAEFCGTKHSEMLSKVVVHEDADFTKWLSDAGNIHEHMSPVEAGQLLVKQRGCLQCHTTDGAASTGPTWKGIWGRQEHLTDGSTVTVDENYVRNSIMTPQAQVVAGFGPVMPTFQGKLKDRDITAIIEYLKTVK